MKKISATLLGFVFALGAARAQGTEAQHTAMRVPETAVQDTGVHFERGGTWAQVLAKAKAENKFIFVDCYTTWCGPCKFMSLHIFPLNEVGEYMNAHFISVEIQMDRTKKDSDEVRQWYGVADSLGKRYTITAYPSYLFFTPEGVAVHRSAGAAVDPGAFLTKAKDALNPEMQYYTIIGHYKEHAGDSAYLRHAVSIAELASDHVSAAAITGDYLESLRNPFTRETLSVLNRNIRSSSDTGFRLLLRHPAPADEVMGRGWAEDLVRRVISREVMDPYYEPGAPPLDWKKLSRKLKKEYPAVADRVISQNKVDYYRVKGQMPAFEKALLSYMKQYGDSLGVFEHNTAAWDAFLFSKNPVVLAEAVKWSKNSIDNAKTLNGRPESNYVNYLDTYANLLYKTGDKDNAIMWEKKALAVAEDMNRQDKVKSYKDSIAKMENGVKTWD